MDTCVYYIPQYEQALADLEQERHQADKAIIISEEEQERWTAANNKARRDQVPASVHVCMRVHRCLQNKESDYHVYTPMAHAAILIFRGILADIHALLSG